MQETKSPTSPFKGLMPYDEDDALFFFGREAEIEIVTANLMASRLTLIYGASGVGKTSILRAGVANHLKELTRHNLAMQRKPEFVVVVFDDWQNDPILGLTKKIHESISMQFFGGKLDHIVPSNNLIQNLEICTEFIRGDLFIILDQFEDYFLYHTQNSREDSFSIELSRAINLPNLRVSFIISIRDDALAKLDYFKGRIPNLFDNYLRINHLDLQAARTVLKKPIEQYNRFYAKNNQEISIESDLVEAVVEQIQTGEVVVSANDRNFIEANSNTVKKRIETPYLQLVMIRLWDEEKRLNSHVLRLETLNSLGGSKHIVKTHLDEVLNNLSPKEQNIVSRIFHYMVTPTGNKVAHTLADLTGYTEMPSSLLLTVLNTLTSSNVRILRLVPPAFYKSIEPPHDKAEISYEIFHDVLAIAILDWQRRYTERQLRQNIQLQELERRQRKYIFSVIKNTAVGLILLLMLLKILELSQEVTIQKNKNNNAQESLKQMAKITVVNNLRREFLSGDLLKQPITLTIMESKLIAFQAIAKPLKVSSFSKTTLYNFQISPVNILSGKLDSVVTSITYRMDSHNLVLDSSFVIITDKKNGFRATFIASGCLDTVRAFIEYLDNRIPEIKTGSICDFLKSTDQHMYFLDK